jgi:pimeloyl-ACP methyl ester carboxylesterase
MAPPTCWLDLPWGRLAYTDTGPVPSGGPPLLLVHGYAGNRGVWEAALPRLAPGRRCIALDLPGHGASAPSPQGYHARTMAGQVAPLLAALDLGPLALVAHSLGTWVGLHLALAAPDQVSALVLSNPPHLAHGVWSGRWVRGRAWERPTLATMQGVNRLAARVAPATGGGLVGAHLRRNAAAAGLPLPLLSATLDAIYAHDLAGAPAQLRLPALVLAGRLDLTAPPAGARDLARRLPDARLHVFGRCGHHPMLERPDAFAAIVGGWLDERLGRGGAAGG